MKPKVLVTGADGFIGSHLVESLLEAGYSVRAFCFYNSQGSCGWIDTLSQEIKSNIQIHLGDIRDYQSVLEGVSFGLNDSLTLMRDVGINPSNVILTGGGTHSTLWKQMLSDIFKSECTLVNAKEGAAYGAALLAAVGIKIKDSVQQASSEWIQETERVSPGEDVKIYGQMYSHYQNLYPSLKEHFSSIAEIT